MSAAYLLDTNILINAIRGKAGSWELLENLVAAGGSLSCSVITVAELYSRLRPHEAVRTRTLIESMDVLNVDQKIAHDAGTLKNEWASRGVTLSINDVLIAATALAHGLTLVTTNLKDFPMPGLRLFPVS